MKQIFTRSARLFWALLLAAVFSSGTAVGQQYAFDNEEGKHSFTFDDESLIAHGVLNSTTLDLATKKENIGGGEQISYLQIKANPGKGKGTYSGLVYIKLPFNFEKGSYYTIELDARTYVTTGKGSPSEASITYVKSSDYKLYDQYIESDTRPSGIEDIGINTINVTGFTKFSVTLKADEIAADNPPLYIGLLLNGLTTGENKPVLEIDNLTITKYTCGSTNAPALLATSFERCGLGTINLVSKNSSSDVQSQWYNKNGQLVYTGNTYPLQVNDFSLHEYTVRAYNSLTGCVSEAVNVTAQARNSITAYGDIISEPASIEVNVPVTFTVVSNIISNQHTDISTIRWWKITLNSLGEEVSKVQVQLGGTSYTMTPTTNEPFTIECDISPSTSSCYNVAKITFTTKSIAPLPVEIIYFTAAKQSNNVLLEWATASEENNTGFEVQVSQDGFNFRKLDFVPTKNGNTVIKQVYTFKDTENGKYGTRYYRLKQIDMDGKFEYFTTKAVSFGEVSSYSLKAFPNPFESEVSLELNADESGKLNVQVLDAMGRSVMTQQFEVSKGRSQEKITLWQSLPKGIYFVRTEMNGHANNFRILKK